ncbi:hypothetical protein GF336_07745 [Candidatus Woesearchaeota archaeon]|nr:hypothetical protein [Candidatus Woesearchaeota archaeon]
MNISQQIKLTAKNLKYSANKRKAKHKLLQLRAKKKQAEEQKAVLAKKQEETRGRISSQEKKITGVSQKEIEELKKDPDIKIEKREDGTIKRIYKSNKYTSWKDRGRRNEDNYIPLEVKFDNQERPIAYIKREIYTEDADDNSDHRRYRPFIKESNIISYDKDGTPERTYKRYKSMTFREDSGDETVELTDKEKWKSGMKTERWRYGYDDGDLESKRYENYLTGEKERKEYDKNRYEKKVSPIKKTNDGTSVYYSSNPNWTPTQGGKDYNVVYIDRSGRTTGKIYNSKEGLKDWKTESGDPVKIDITKQKGHNATTSAISNYNKQIAKYESMKRRLENFYDKKALKESKRLNNNPFFAKENELLWDYTLNNRRDKDDIRDTPYNGRSIMDVNRNNSEPYNMDSYRNYNIPESPTITINKDKPFWEKEAESGLRNKYKDSYLFRKGADLLGFDNYFKNNKEKLAEVEEMRGSSDEWLHKKFADKTSESTDLTPAQQYKEFKETDRSLNKWRERFDRVYDSNLLALTGSKIDNTVPEVIKDSDLYNLNKDILLGLYDTPKNAIREAGMETPELIYTGFRRNPITDSITGMYDALIGKDATARSRTTALASLALLGYGVPKLYQYTKKKGSSTGSGQKELLVKEYGTDPETSVRLWRTLKDVFTDGGRLSEDLTPAQTRRIITGLDAGDILDTALSEASDKTGKLNQPIMITGRVIRNLPEGKTRNTQMNILKDDNFIPAGSAYDFGSIPNFKRFINEIDKVSEIEPSKIGDLDMVSKDQKGSYSAKDLKVPENIEMPEGIKHLPYIESIGKNKQEGIIPQAHRDYYNKINKKNQEFIDIRSAKTLNEFRSKIMQRAKQIKDNLRRSPIDFENIKGITPEQIALSKSLSESFPLSIGKGSIMEEAMLQRYIKNQDQIKKSKGQARFEKGKKNRYKLDSDELIIKLMGEDIPFKEAMDKAYGDSNIFKMSENEFDALTKKMRNLEPQKRVKEIKLNYPTIRKYKVDDFKRVPKGFEDVSYSKDLPFKEPDSIKRSREWKEKYGKEEDMPTKDIDVETGQVRKLNKKQALRFKETLDKLTGKPQKAKIDDISLKTGYIPIEGEPPMSLSADVLDPSMIGKETTNVKKGRGLFFEGHLIDETGKITPENIAFDVPTTEDHSFRLIRAMRQGDEWMADVAQKKKFRGITAKEKIKSMIERQPLIKMGNQVFPIQSLKNMWKDSIEGATKESPKKLKRLKRISKFIDQGFYKQNKGKYRYLDNDQIKMLTSAENLIEKGIVPELSKTTDHKGNIIKRELNVPSLDENNIMMNKKKIAEILKKDKFIGGEKYIYSNRARREMPTFETQMRKKIIGSELSGLPYLQDKHAQRSSAQFAGLNSLLRKHSKPVKIQKLNKMGNWEKVPYKENLPFENPSLPAEMIKKNKKAFDKAKEANTLKLMQEGRLYDPYFDTVGEIPLKLKLLNERFNPFKKIDKNMYTVRKGQEMSLFKESYSPTKTELKNKFKKEMLRREEKAPTKESLEVLNKELNKIDSNKITPKQAKEIAGKAYESALKEYSKQNTAKIKRIIESPGYQRKLRYQEKYKPYIKKSLLGLYGSGLYNNYKPKGSYSTYPITDSPYTENYPIQEYPPTYDGYPQLTPYTPNTPYVPNTPYTPYTPKTPPMTTTTPGTPDVPVGSSGTIPKNMVIPKTGKKVIAYKPIWKTKSGKEIFGKDYQTVLDAINEALIETDRSPLTDFRIKKVLTDGTLLKGRKAKNLHKFYKKGSVYKEKKRYQKDMPSEKRRRKVISTNNQNKGNSQLVWDVIYNRL